MINHMRNFAFDVIIGEQRMMHFKHVRILSRKLRLATRTTGKKIKVKFKQPVSHKLTHRHAYNKQNLMLPLPLPLLCYQYLKWFSCLYIFTVCDLAPACVPKIILKFHWWWLWWWQPNPYYLHVTFSFFLHFLLLFDLLIFVFTSSLPSSPSFWWIFI